MTIQRNDDLVDAAPELLDLCNVADDRGVELASYDKEFVRFLNRLQAESDGRLVLTPR